MMFSQQMKLSELQTFQERLIKGQDSSDQLSNFLQDLKIEIDLPGIEGKDLELSFSGDTVTISRTESAEDKYLQLEAGSIIAKNIKTKVALGIVGRIAKTDDPVVIFGENGTGKALFAHTIHQHGTRREQPFITISCGTIDKDRAEQQMKDSLVDVGVGTLLLDDIQDLDVDAQRILQKLIQTPVEQKHFRVITATSADLYELVRKGEFSAELLAILQNCYIELLPLQQRQEDIEALVSFYNTKICQSRGLEPKNISPDLLRMLETYHWPGNVLELVNTVEQLLMTAQNKPTLFAKDLPAHIRIQTIKSSAAQKKGI